MCWLTADTELPDEKEEKCAKGEEKSTGWPAEDNIDLSVLGVVEAVETASAGLLVASAMLGPGVVEVLLAASEEG